MEATAQQFLEEDLAPSIHKVYKEGWNRSIAFTRSFGLSSSPLTAEKVTLFVAYLGSQGLYISTIQSYMAALRHFQVLAKLLRPHCFYSTHMVVLLRGIKRYQSQQNPKSIQLPITASLMHHIKLFLTLQPLDVAVNKPERFNETQFQSGMQSRLLSTSRIVKAHSLSPCD